MLFSLCSAFLGLTHAAARPRQSLQIAKYGTTTHGFNTQVRGWNSYGIQSNGEIVSGWKFDQDHAQQQCELLAKSPLKDAGFIYCSLDSGWSVGGNGDESGRIIPETSLFSDIKGFADDLHAQGLKLGVYVVPGAFISDGSKTIMGTNVTIDSVCSGNEGLARCVFDYDQDAVQTWHDSVVAQFAEWGVDLIKLDYITPGSPSNGQNLPEDQSEAVVAWSKAIENSGRNMRLHISWKLDRTESYFQKWNSASDAMRTDQDINESNSDVFVKWRTVQRAIENYRQWVVAGISELDEFNTYPDLDNLYIGNEESISGINNAQRQTVFSHWIGAGAGLILGSDLTQLDDYATQLLTTSAALAVADFTAKFPMQPRNPGTGGQDAAQVQAWVAGPDGDGSAVVLLANYGPDEGAGGWGSDKAGTQQLDVSWAKLGLHGGYMVHDVWSGSDWDDVQDGLSVGIGEGGSYLLKLTPA